jgi:pimeloyl-[acyl-carrier protein] methyl ester esterase
MTTFKPKLVLLPGLDGTGKLFKDFVAAVPDQFESDVVSYPTDEYIGYPKLADRIRVTLSSAGPFVLIAESFSTPLAIQLAAERPKSLAGLVVCAGFASSPVTGLLRVLCSQLGSALFRMPLTDAASRFFLLGADAPSYLVHDVREAISTVSPDVLASRLLSVLACDVRANLAQVLVPILYIRAMQDRLVGPHCPEEIRQINPRTNITSISGPHLILQRHPTESAKVVAEWISEMGFRALTPPGPLPSPKPTPTEN